MPPEPVLGALGSEPGETVCDVGAGLGWLSLRLARRVGMAGTVWAVEPGADAVEALAETARMEGLGHLHAIEGFAEALPLPDASVDRVLWHTVALHMGNRTAAMAETLRVLRPGGRWVVVDWKQVETPMGPPLERRVSAETILKEAAGVGFRLVERFEPGPVTWGLAWIRP